MFWFVIYIAYKIFWGDFMSELIPVDESRADFFVTGNEYMRDGLDLRFIPRANLCNNDIGGG